MSDAELQRIALSFLLTHVEKAEDEMDIIIDAGHLRQLEAEMFNAANQEG